MEDDMTKQNLLTLTILLGSTIAAPAGELKPMDEVAAVAGTFRSAAPEPWYGGYGVREFVMQDGYWRLIFTHAMDPQMINRTFQYRAGGPFELLEASADVTGAFQGRFVYDWKHVTLLTENADLQVGYGLSDCNLTINLEVDISETGCGHWRPVAACGADYDLLALSDAGLHWGVRAADNNQCTPDRTPKALLPAVAPFGG
jgi:hypothetical protein